MALIKTFVKFMNIFDQAQASVQSDITVVNWLCHPPNTEVSWADFAPKYLQDQKNPYKATKYHKAATYQCGGENEFAAIWAIWGFFNHTGTGQWPPSESLFPKKCILRWNRSQAYWVGVGPVNNPQEWWWHQWPQLIPSFQAVQAWSIRLKIT